MIPQLSRIAAVLKGAFGFVTANRDPVTGGIEFLAQDANLAATFSGQSKLGGFLPNVQNALAAAYALRNITTAPNVVETSPTFNVGTRYYIDPNHPSANNSNAGTSPSAPWADLWKISGLNPGAGAIIHVAADAVFDYGDTLAAYTARTKFPYTSADNLNGTAAQPVVIRPYFPRASTQKKPVVRWYAKTVAGDWTQEAGYGGKVWSIPLAVAYNNAYRTFITHGASDTMGIAAGQNTNAPGVLYADGHYAVDANKVYVYSSGGNPVTALGGVKVVTFPVLSTAWGGMRYLKVFGMRFELAWGVGLDFAANSATLHGGIEIAGCDVAKARLAYVRNQQTHATPQELSVTVHDCYFEDVPGAPVHLGPTQGTAGNTVSWEFFRNAANRANLNSSFGAVLYNQSTGGTRHHAWSNYGYDCRNGIGDCNIDGSFIYSDVATVKAVVYANIAERCGVAFQANSALGCLIVANAMIDCWKAVQTTGTGTDSTPNMVCDVAHNTWLWTGRISKSDLPLGAGVAADNAGVFTQWNDQSGAGRMYANYSWLNNLVINASETPMTRPAEYHVSAGVTTLTIGGNAIFGFSDVLVKDNTSDVSANAEYVTLRGTAQEAQAIFPGAKKGGIRALTHSRVAAAGIPLSVQYQDITGKNFASPPTPGCLEVIF